MRLEKEPNQNVLFAKHQCIWLISIMVQGVLCVLSAALDLIMKIH